MCCPSRTYTNVRTFSRSPCWDLGDTRPGRSACRYVSSPRVAPGFPPHDRLPLPCISGTMRNGPTTRAMENRLLGTLCAGGGGCGGRRQMCELSWFLVPQAPRPGVAIALSHMWMDIYPQTDNRCFLFPQAWVRPASDGWSLSLLQLSGVDINGGDLMPAATVICMRLRGLYGR